MGQGCPLCPTLPAQGRLVPVSPRMLEVSGGFMSSSLPTSSIPDLGWVCSREGPAYPPAAKKALLRLIGSSPPLVMTSQQAVKAHDDITDLGDSWFPHSTDTEVPGSPLCSLPNTLMI